MAPPPGILEVRCAGCGETLEVEHGLTEFACPDCGMAQALPPELMPPRPRRALPLPGRFAPSATPVRVSCGGCGSLLSVPHGPGRFACPLCGAELTVPAAAVSVVATPAAVLITPTRPGNLLEVQGGSSIQSARAGNIAKPFHSEQIHGELPNHYFRKESFGSFRAETRTQIPAAGRLQNVPPNPSLHREESHTELLHGNISMPDKKKYRFVVGPKSGQAGKAQEEHPNQVVHASHAQGTPPNPSGSTNKAGEFPDETNAMLNKQKDERVPVSSVIEHEQISSLHQIVHGQQAGEAPSHVVHVDQEKVDSALKAVGNNKKSGKGTKGNQKRKNKSLMNSSNETSHLRRSKRLSKGSPDLANPEPIQKLHASPNQNQSEAPQIEVTVADPDPSSPTRYRSPQAGSKELDNIDETTPALNHDMLQTEQFPQVYSQMYSPEIGWALPNPSTNPWHEHEIPQESYNGIDQLSRSDDVVHPNLPGNENQYMDGQVALLACSGKNHLEQVQHKPHNTSYEERARQKNNGIIGSSNDAENSGDSSFSGARHQINLAASCSRLAALLPAPAATTGPIVASLSSLEEITVNGSSPTTQHHQPRYTLASQDAQCDDMLSGSISKSSKKYRGRPPAVLMEPRKEADRPVLTPNGTANWNVHPPCPKVATTLSLLIKQNYPGTYVSVDTNEEPCELVVHYWHQYPSDLRATMLDEFLKRYKWSPGQEDECRKIFDRKAVRQLVNLFCYEKQRVREELAAKQPKRSLAVGRADGEMALEVEDDRENSEEQEGDGSVVALEPDDPLNWKPFVPDWMQPRWWEMLCDLWANDEFMKVSFQKRKNRHGEKWLQRLKSMDNGSKLAEPSAKIDSGEAGLVGKKASRAEDTRYRHSHVQQEQVGSSKRGKYYGTPIVNKKSQIDSSPKSCPSSSSKQGQQPMFTQDQVQQMINQALHGLNETWEKKFVSLEQNMHSLSSSHIVPLGAKSSEVAVAGDKQCQLARQDTLDSADGEKDPGGREDREEEEDDWS